MPYNENGEFYALEEPMEETRQYSEEDLDVAYFLEEYVPHYVADYVYANEGVVLPLEEAYALGEDMVAQLDEGGIAELVDDICATYQFGAGETIKGLWERGVGAIKRAGKWLGTAPGLKNETLRGYAAGGLQSQREAARIGKRYAAAVKAASELEGADKAAAILRAKGERSVGRTNLEIGRAERGVGAIKERIGRGARWLANRPRYQQGLIGAAAVGTPTAGGIYASQRSGENKKRRLSEDEMTMDRRRTAARRLSQLGYRTRDGLFF